MVFTANPLKIALVLIEQIKHISKKFSTMTNLATEVKTILIQFGMHVINKSVDGEEIERMARDELFNGLKVIDLVGYLNVTEWMGTSHFENIINQMWQSPYEIRHIWRWNTMFHIVNEVPGKMTDKLDEGHRYISTKEPSIRKESMGFRHLRTIGQEICNKESHNDRASWVESQLSKTK